MKQRLAVQPIIVVAHSWNCVRRFKLRRVEGKRDSWQYASQRGTSYLNSGCPWVSRLFVGSGDAIEQNASSGVR
jgi:hypothetical protein